MDRNFLKQYNFKIIFSIVSFLLMIPPLIKDSPDYYTTIFIFLINRIIDSSFDDRQSNYLFLNIWNLLNQWFGIITGAIAFCCIASDFLKICEKYKNGINYIILTSSASYILKDIIEVFISSIVEMMTQKKFKNDLNKKGE